MGWAAAAGPGSPNSRPVRAPPSSSTASVARPWNGTRISLACIRGGDRLRHLRLVRVGQQRGRGGIVVIDQSIQYYRRAKPAPEVPGIYDKVFVVAQSPL